MVISSTKQSVDEIKEITVKSINPKRLQIDVKSYDEILQKFAKEKDLYEIEHRAYSESAKNHSVSKLFSIKGDTTAIVATKTLWVTT